MSLGVDDQSSDDDRTLVIAIDFGTTYSAVAYSMTNRPNQIIPCNSWPSNSGDNDQPQVPTTIRYFPERRGFEWGFQISNTVHPDEIMHWFKLGLQNSDSRPDNIQTMLAHQDADRLVTDYLSGLGQYIMTWIEKTLGSNQIEIFTKRSAIQFVLTVPAVWEDLAKRRTQQAFENSRPLGRLGGVTMISEPEAAATYALHTMSKEDTLEVGQSFILLDAGGGMVANSVNAHIDIQSNLTNHSLSGTVDTITYTITALHPMLQVREATAGAGDFCGSAFIDKAFADYLQVTLGNEEGFNNEVLGRARTNFEEIVRGTGLKPIMEHTDLLAEQAKRAFDHSFLPNGRSTVAVPGMKDNQAAGLRNGSFTLRAADTFTMFEPYILRTIALVKNQIRTANVPITSVILVGGFGASGYLRERLKKEVEDDMEIPVRFSKDSLMAVVYGAVMRGMANAAPEKHTVLRVVDRAARSYKEHYGTEFSVVYDAVKHRELANKRSWDGLDGCWRVDTMKWFIRYGDRVAEDRPHTHHFRQTSRVAFGRPQRIFLTVDSDNTSTEAPLARNDNVKILCHVVADLSLIPTEQLPVQRGRDGFDYYVLSCEIEAVYRSATTEYTLIHNNVRYDTVSS
ncbi:Hsp70-like protein, partial [Apiospora kogelbergensis]|uniref:Hsp70-like protein n=1 Tax=Apiospora kogelbergensis TaxID=1337665 RepID=UPI0031326258